MSGSLIWQGHRHQTAHFYTNRCHLHALDESRLAS
jgi:hypothetical protein